MKKKIEEKMGENADYLSSEACYSGKTPVDYSRMTSEIIPEMILAEAMPAYTVRDLNNMPSGEDEYEEGDGFDGAKKPVYTRQGEYTLEDYYALPDEQRVELIDGVFYDMAAPAVIHQTILAELYILFRECIDAHGGKCRVLFSPCDVRLDRDNRTMVQPDLLVLCEGYDVGAKRIEGAPDLTLEILSPSTRSKDMLLKLHKYSNAGVREYWIVDPERREILVYDLEHKKELPKHYDFNDTIPIMISGGECRIDFSRVLRQIES